MESEDVENSPKRLKQTIEGEATEEAAEGDLIVVSEEMQLRINTILESIDQFTQQVSELLEAGKTLFKDLSNSFEERLITIHKEQMEKWNEEIRELRLLDGSNEEANALLQNARQLLQMVHIEG